MAGHRFRQLCWALAALLCQSANACGDWMRRGNGFLHHHRSAWKKLFWLETRLSLTATTSPKWAQSKSYAVQAPKERIAKFKGTKGSNVGHIHPAVSIADTASFNKHFTKDARRPYWQPCNSKGKYTVTLIEGDGIGPEISEAVKDIFAAAKVGHLFPLAEQGIIFVRPQSIGNRLTSHHNLKMGRLSSLTRQFKAWRRTILLWKDLWR